MPIYSTHFGRYTILVGTSLLLPFIYGIVCEVDKDELALDEQIGFITEAGGSIIVI